MALFPNNFSDDIPSPASDLKFSSFTLWTSRIKPSVVQVESPELVQKFLFGCQKASLPGVPLREGRAGREEVREDRAVSSDEQEAEGLAVKV